MGNVALNATVTIAAGSMESGSAPLSVITNGNTSTNDYTAFNSGLSAVQVDLGSVQTIGSIIVWHYYGDGRIYNSTKTEISTDGVTWTTVFDSSVSGKYSESAAGHGIALNDVPVRYIRDWLQGSDRNPSSHWVEIQANTPLNLPINSNYGSVTGADWSRNSVRATDVTNDFVELCTNGVGSDSASLISSAGPFKYDEGDLVADMSLLGSADQLYIGWLDASVAPTALTAQGIGGQVGFYGLVLDMWNDRIGAVNNGVIGATVGYNPDTGGARTTWKVECRFTSSSALQYKLYKNGTLIATLVGSRPSFLTGSRIAFGAWTGGASGTYRVYGAPSFTSLVPTAPPDAVTGLAVDGFDQGLFVRWDTITGVTGYEYRVDGGAAVATDSTFPAQSITGLVNGQQYQVEVRALNVVGAGAWTSISGSPELTYLFDHFNRPSVSSPGSPPQGGPYSIVALGTTGSPQFGITNDSYLYRVDAAASIDGALIAPGQADVDIEVVLKNQHLTDQRQDRGIVFRFKDKDNFWIFSTFNGGMLGAKHTGATTWAYFQDLDVTFADNDVIRVVAKGPRIVVYRNGGFLFQTTDPWYDPTPANNSLGLRHFNNAQFQGANTGWWDYIKVRPPASMDRNGAVAEVGIPPGSALPLGFVYKGRDTRIADTGSVA